MAGATQIEIVFDCTEETSYNEWASIDLSCDVDGEQAAYVQFKGKGDYTTGTKAWKEILEIPALRAGASYKVQGTTYAWSNITDDIYRIQAVNFYDDDETLLMSVEAANGPADVVNSAVAEAEKKAEALHTGDYTEDSTPWFVVARRNEGGQSIDNVHCPDGWRVPSLKDMMLVWIYEGKESLSVTDFQPGAHYWTNDVASTSPYVRWYIGLERGETSTLSQGEGSTSFVTRCVRDR